MAGESPAHEMPRSETPFQLLIVGDFSGRANRALHAPLSGRRPLRVDCDSLDDTMAQMGVALHCLKRPSHFGNSMTLVRTTFTGLRSLFAKLEDARSQPPREPSPASKTAGASGNPLELGRSLLDGILPPAFHQTSIFEPKGSLHARHDRSHRGRAAAHIVSQQLLPRWDLPRAARFPRRSSATTSRMNAVLTIGANCSVSTSAILRCRSKSKPCLFHLSRSLQRTISFTTWELLGPEIRQLTCFRSCRRKNVTASYEANSG